MPSSIASGALAGAACTGALTLRDWTAAVA
jgi:hypothetical protein